jgi:transcription elongation factor GreA
MGIEMSKQAYEQLQAERIQAAEAVEAARRRVEDAQDGGGDGEGLESVAAVFEADQLSSELARIDNLLKGATIRKGSSDGLVGVGSRIKLNIEGDVEEYTFDNITGPGRIGAESPIGEAIYGKKVGEVVSVLAPGGTFKVEILSVE